MHANSGIVTEQWIIWKLFGGMFGGNQHSEFQNGHFYFLNSVFLKSFTKEDKLANTRDMLLRQGRGYLCQFRDSGSYVAVD